MSGEAGSDPDLEAVLDWLYVSEDSGWTCPACGYRNGGAYRLECKYCNGPEEGEAGPSNRHPLADEIKRLWLRVGRPFDEEFDELLGPPDWPTTTGVPRSVPPQWKRWP